MRRSAVAVQIRESAQEALLAKARLLLARIRHEHPEKVLSVVAALTQSLENFPGSAGFSQKSDITDDGTPFEFSLSFKTHQQIGFRLLWEAQPVEHSPDPLLLWAAAERVNRIASRLPGVSLLEFEKIKSDFIPLPEAPARFSMWHALDFDANGDFLLKAYFNPEARSTPVDTTLAALEKLGLAPLAQSFRNFLSFRAQDTVLYFSIDLTAAENRRAKVYIAHANTTTDELEKILCHLNQPEPGNIPDWIYQTCGNRGPFSQRPVITCLSSKPGVQAVSSTLHFPIRCYVKRDAEAIAGLSHLLEPDPLKTLETTLTRDFAFPLHQGLGAISYVSRKTSSEEKSTTVYLQPHFMQSYSLPELEKMQENSSN